MSTLRLIGLPLGYLILLSIAVVTLFYALVAGPIFTALLHAFFEVDFFSVSTRPSKLLRPACFVL